MNRELCNGVVLFMGISVVHFVLEWCMDHVLHIMCIINY